MDECRQLTIFGEEIPQQTLPAPQSSLPAAPAAEKGSLLTRVQAVAELLSALDGYSNAAAFLGEDSPLISSGTFRRSGLSRKCDQWSLFSSDFSLTENLHSDMIDSAKMPDISIFR